MAFSERARQCKIRSIFTLIKEDVSKIENTTKSRKYSTAPVSWRKNLSFYRKREAFSGEKNGDIVGVPTIVFLFSGGNLLWTRFLFVKNAMLVLDLLLVIFISTLWLERYLLDYKNYGTSILTLESLKHVKT